MTDLFCGAGGSSTGALSVPGVSVRMAANHWPLAIETHNTNHPDTDHACADISQVDPRRFPRTDILWASPECTNHSVAKGRKRNLDSTPDLFGEILPDEAADRSRATMWDVPRFAEHHKYRAIITENVVDAAKWIMFPAWLQAMDLLGYDHHIVYMNSMHAQAAGDPAPQSRDRMYVVFWVRGNRAPDLDRWTRPRAYCPYCEEVVSAVQAWKKPTRWGRYRAQYVWRCPRVSCRNAIVEPGWLPAAAAIDWTIKGERIGDRARPLAAKTVARIEAGLRKFADGEPFVATMRGQSKCHRAAEPLTTVSAGGGHHGLLVPVEGRDGKDARSAADPLRTMTTRNETALLVPYYGKGVARTSDDPHGTFTTRDKYAFVVPLRANNTPKPVAEPYDTFAANGNHHALAQAETVDVDDCLFRMLEPHEIAAGMAFPRDYRILGTKREQVRQAGNAVCPPNARDLIAAIAESLGVAA
ncbi:DNA cytosine methyltransferase [Rhodococcus hoagii]|nr:DNA cytosine methyltransferase [Prescottella equi]MBM4577216.1 DNA cytosine methyltransferase [Prescottella equi]NKV08509.1 DNA cytosine methyltransferase [Prescottella equi]NKV08514.1 DNA cytosine methyltransferase [Prescottella equi]NKV09767.1 DNA cytosine methyltransferase [Prescottella equi]